MKNKKLSYTTEVHAGRIAIINEIAGVRDWNKNDDKDFEDNENYREPLCVDVQTVYKIVLSTGGPDDGFKLFFDTVDGRQELSHGVYYRADWGEYKESALSDDEAQMIVDFYLGGYIE